MNKGRDWRLRIVWLCLALAVSGFSQTLADTDPLPSWNEGQAKQNIFNFVQAVTKESGPDFVRPSERIAVFDNDGTLWVEKPVYTLHRFALDELRNLPPHFSKKKTDDQQEVGFKDKLDTIFLSSKLLVLEMATLGHITRTTDQFDQIASSWLATAKQPRFQRPYTECVYQPMLELMSYLRANGFKTYIVSGGGEEFVRQWSESVYGVPPEQVIGSSLQMRMEQRHGTPEIVRLPRLPIIDDKSRKPVCIYRYTGHRPIAAFGNSDGDLAMLQWVTSGPGKRFGMIVHHTDAEREWAYDRKSHVGRLSKALDEAPKRGWTVVSMKDDWKKMFPFSQP